MTRHTETLDAFEQRGEDPARMDYGWRYEIQREHVRGEGPYYSLMIAPPTMENGYREGFDKSRLLRPVMDDGDGTQRGVRRVMNKHRAYIDKQMRARGQGRPL